MAADFREKREAARAQAAREQARAAKRPDVFSNLPALIQEEYGLTGEEAALAVRNAVFALYPDDAPPEHRQALWEARQARKEREATEQRFAQAQQQYRYNLELAARSATDTSFPDSVAFYDGDHGRYARALEKKALAMAQQAEQEGRFVEVTVPSVQAALEADLAARLTKAQQKRAGRAKPAEAAPVATSSQSVASSLHTASSATPAATPRKGKLTREEADREVMAILQREFSRS